MFLCFYRLAEIKIDFEIKGDFNGLAEIKGDFNGRVANQNFFFADWNPRWTGPAPGLCVSGGGRLT